MKYQFDISLLEEFYSQSMEFAVVELYGLFKSMIENGSEIVFVRRHKQKAPEIKQTVYDVETLKRFMVGYTTLSEYDL